MTILEMFPNSIKIDPITNCWLWQGPFNGDYGIVVYNSNRILTHRLSAHFSLGLLLDDSEVQVNHKQECKNKNCCNFDHLYLGNQGDNNRDTAALGNTVNQNTYKTHCLLGHPLEGKNLYITKKGARVCIICNRRRTREYRLRTNPLAKSYTKSKI